MREEYALLVALVRNQMDGTPFVLPEDTDLLQLAKIARQHRLAPFVYEALAGYSLPEEASAILSSAYNKAIFRDAQFDHVQRLVRRVLEQQGIEHVFMRGICLKQDYPQSALRTMTDIDVLVHTRDLSAIRKAMKPLDAEIGFSDGNHRSYIFPPNTEVEFHPMLLHCGCAVGTGINPGWQYVPGGQPGACKEMSPEGFYLNVMCHFANHFFSGGAGIRFVLDIWVCRHLRKQQPDRAFVERELDRVGLLDFARNVELLAECWFSGVPMPDSLREMEEYIFTSGLHGREDRAMLNAICFSPKGTGVSALLKRAFHPKEDLENRFDWVHGRPWLLIPAWCARAFGALTKRRNEVFRWGKGTQQFSAAQVAAQQEKLRRFGVKCKENG